MKKVDAIRVLRDDHKTLKGLFRQIEAIDQRAEVMKAGVCRELFMELEIHTKIEEDHFYPFVEENLKDDTSRALISTSYEDHSRAKSLISELRTLDIESTLFVEKINDLITEVEQHLDKEENELFPIVHRNLPEEELSSLAEKMNEEKIHLLKLPEYRTSQPEIVQNPSGGEQLRTKRSA